MKKRRSLLVKAQVPEVAYQKSKSRYFWGADDNLPSEFLRAISDSGTAMQCVSKLTAFIIGTGFTDEGAKGYMINPKQNANMLLSDVSSGMAVFESLSLRVLYRADGTRGSIYRIPIKTLRKADNGMWIYNPNKGTKDYKAGDDVYYRPFTPDVPPSERAKIIADEIAKYGKQLGEILVEFKIKEVEGGDIYPIPDAYSGIEDIRTDASLQRQDEKNVRKGYRASLVISMPGETDDQTPDDNGKTESDYLRDDLKAFAGEDATKSVLLLESKVKGEAPTVTPFPVSEILDGTSEARDRISKTVCRHLGVPPVLGGFDAPAILGNTQALVNSMKLFMASIVDRQAMISRVFKQLLPDIDWTIGKLNIIDSLPPEVMAKLTEDEIRALGGYAPIPSEIDTNVKTLAETIGVGGTQALITVLTDLVLTNIQKRESLIILFGLTPEQALKLTPDGTTN